ncbi:ABC transporter permease [Lentilactobacillus kosonis]|uniref:ABC transporter permease protein n=1 Tax=Lentilactobacillus kosonis TaxID=2810561 RepID=A0A401FMN2_9LACO|nr:ABC transporter permease [Lentilactobacillus kosonis]GAY73576.1 ABC transporter permease protein [Lentilactobacillus kosonis]
MIIDGIGQGLMWACLTIGVFITFRILDIPDLTTEGSFPLGAAVTIKLMLSGQSAVVAMLCGFGAGFLAGMVTGLLDTQLHIPSLLAGILTMTGLYSVNMHIMGKANIPLLDQKVLTNYLPETWDVTVQTIVIGVIICTIVVALLVMFFKTQSGLALRATGNNTTMSAANGIKTNRTIVLGYAISNGLIAVSGSLIAQSNGFADIGMGIGTIVIGLASVLVGEIILPAKKMVWRLIAMVLGAIVYRVLLTLAMNVGVSPDDLKILSAIILVIVIVLPMIQNQYRSRQQLKRYLQKLNLNSGVKTDE